MYLILEPEFHEEVCIYKVVHTTKPGIIDVITECLITGEQTTASGKPVSFYFPNGF